VNDDATEICIKVENHDHYATCSTNDDFTVFSQNNQKQKQEIEFVSSQWDTTVHSPGPLQTNNLGSYQQLSTGTHLNVQSQMSPTIQTPSKSGTPNSINPYKVLPPVTPTGSGHLTHEDFLLPPGSAMSTFSGISGLSPLGLSPAGSSFVSPRHSAKSNSRTLFSAARKRTLSVSPLSMDGIDLNALIRVSPSSLLFGGSLNASPLPPIGTGSLDHSGTYGHLTARNALTPSNGSLSRQLLAATPSSMIMPFDHHSLHQDEYMASAYANVIGNQHVKHYNDSAYLAENFYPSSNLAVQQPDINFDRVHKNKTEFLKQVDPVTCQQSTSTHRSKQRNSNNNSRISAAETHRSTSVHSVPADRINPSTLNVAHDRHHDLQPPINNVHTSGKALVSQNGSDKTWICQWLECNLIFKVCLFI